MINSHQFQQAAKQFRAGRISLKEFTDLVISGQATRKPNEGASAKKETQSAAGGGVSAVFARDAETHKGDYGRVLAIGGASGMAGAIALTALAALRTGSGLVKVATPASATVAGFSPCLMTVHCEDSRGEFSADVRSRIAAEIDWADVIAIGPGIGQSAGAVELVRELYGSCEKPLVVDADALNALASNERCTAADFGAAAGPRVLTPHEAEFARLLGASPASRSESEAAAKKFAAQHSVVVVLKGHHTLVTDGAAEFRNQTGNAGMATAGAGDVLTGVIASLIGQSATTASNDSSDVYDACCLAVELHGTAGDLAADRLGQPSLIATDLIEHLFAAIKAKANAPAVPIGFAG